MILGIFELLIIAAILFLVLMAAVNPTRRRQALKVGAVLAGTFLAIAGLIVFLVVVKRISHRPPWESTQSGVYHEVTIEDRPQDRTEWLGDIVGGGSEWLPDVEDTHAADVYCSREAAARQLGRQVAEAIKEQMSDADSPDSVSSDSVRVWVGVDLDEIGDSESIYGAFAETLRSQVPLAVVSLSEGEETGDRNEDVHVTVLAFKWDKEPAAWDKSQQQLSGDLHAHLQWNTRQRDFSARFIHKPWLAEYNAFASAHPDRQLLLVRGSDEQETVRIAAKTLLPKVEARLRSEFREIPAWWSDQAQDYLATQITERRLRIDRFSQTFSTQLGETSFPAYSREAILIDYSSPKLEEAIHHMSIQLQQAHSRRAASWASVAGLFVLICGVYLALNAATKGYYTWVLRGAAVVLLIATIVVLVA